jgi:hypothetical protein
MFAMNFNPKGEQYCRMLKTIIEMAMILNEFGCSEVSRRTYTASQGTDR